MIIYLLKIKFFFHVFNILIIFLYLYPGSLLGYYFKNDISTHPQLTVDFIISSNHFYTFLFLSAVGVFSYLKSKYIYFLFFYLIFLSIVLEVLHLIIPGRIFQFSDLFGNIFGVLLTFITYYLFIKYEES